MTFMSDVPEPRAGAAAESDPFLSLRGGGTEIYLIRHADALPDADEVIDGGYDIQSLSELGRRQARALAVRLKDANLSAIYASPIGRARETAAAVAEAAGLELCVEPELREVALGMIGPEVGSGASQEAVAQMLRERLREIATIALNGGNWDAIPGSEPAAELRARVTAAVHSIAARHPGQRVAAVSHGGAINAYFAALLGIQRDYFFPAANTSISVVRIKGERTLLLALNDVSHLREGGLLKGAE